MLQDSGTLLTLFLEQPKNTFRKIDVFLTPQVKEQSITHGDIYTEP